jgi:hypothetical protein
LDPASGQVLLSTSESLGEVSLANEGKDMWRIYLDHQVGDRDGLPVYWLVP